MPKVIKLTQEEYDKRSFGAKVTDALLYTKPEVLCDFDGLADDLKEDYESNGILSDLNYSNKVKAAVVKRTYLQKKMSVPKVAGLGVAGTTAVAAPAVVLMRR